ncbi:MAG: hypothetical protein ACK5X3_00050 [Pseudomonadota bacterium]|jgi:hypothetical protein
MTVKTTLLAATLIALGATSVFAKPLCKNTAFTKEQIAAVQQAWGDGIVAIGKASDPKAAASAFIDQMYAYDLGTVLFKPTKARVVPFRDTKEEALSYFVTGKEAEDKGFAITPFIKVRFENAGTVLDCDSALAMGHYYFTKTDGQEIKVEYSFGYVPAKDGSVKINLQHSSLPYRE